jgi:DNA-binding response OmpR family regulator
MDWRMHRQHILVVENEPAIAHTIKVHLETHAGFTVEVASTGHAALRAIGAFVPDALLLDTLLPDIPGSEMCRAIRSRERTAQLPLILLGERSVLGPVAGLELGADDYLLKPVDTAELAARFHALLRRRVVQPRYAKRDHFKGVHIEARFDEVVVRVDGRPVALTKREFALLRLLFHARNRVLDRKTLLANVCGSNRQVRAVDAAVWRLRSKLKKAGRQIETVPGRGYRFNEPPKATRHK